MISLNKKYLPDYIKLVFCDFLEPQEVVCHRTGKRLNVLVSDQLVNSPKTVSLIKNDLIKKLAGDGG
jgi:hypothetical protein